MRETPEGNGLKLECDRILVGGLVRSFLTVLFVVTALWCVTSFLSFRDILIGRPVLFLNLAISAGLGWYYYRYRHHETLKLDDEGFSVWKGGRTARATWGEFRAVSLVHLGRGAYVVRLYFDPEWTRSVDIGASRLGVDPFWLRRELGRRIGG